MAQNDEKNARIAARAQVAEVRTREAQVEVAEKRLRDVRHVVPGGLRPGAGTGGTPVSDVFVVAERFVATGDYVSVGAPLFRLVDADPLEVRASVPERRMEEVAVGTGARVTLSASPTPVAGKVVRIRPEVDPATRTVQVEIDVPNAELRLAPGAFATVEFDIGTDRGVPLLSESAVRTFAGVRKVFVVTGGKAAERIVTLGRRSGDRVEVTSGLKAGEAYVAAPPAGLYAGVPVTVEGGGAPAAPEKGK
jgi:Cu(I)/Ag(I) efflux system membrane fusion protein